MTELSVYIIHLSYWHIYILEAPDDLDIDLEPPAKEDIVNAIKTQGHDQ